MICLSRIIERLGKRCVASKRRVENTAPRKVVLSRCLDDPIRHVSLYSTVRAIHGTRSAPLPLDVSLICVDLRTNFTEKTYRTDTSSVIDVYADFYLLQDTHTFAKSQPHYCLCKRAYSKFGQRYTVEYLLSIVSVSLLKHLKIYLREIPILYIMYLFKNKCWYVYTDIL
jgi:hypothetical protein